MKLPSRDTWTMIGLFIFLVIFMLMINVFELAIITAIIGFVILFEEYL